MSHLFHRSVLSFHSSPRCFAVDKLVLSKLRKKTGFAISQCKKALELHDSDINKADEWLQKEAQAHGWAKATKLSGRATTQGLIGVHVEGNVGGLVEINCETDFVARNTDFQALVQTLTKEFTLSNLSSSNHKAEPIKESVEKEKLGAIKTKDGESFSDLVALAIGKIGENIQLCRGVKFVCSPEIDLVGYTHPPSEDNSGLFGKYGTVVALKNSNKSDVIREICAHIIGMNPKTIGVYDDTLLEKEDSEKSTKLKEENVDNILDHEDEGKDEKYPEEKEKPLVYQDFITEPEYTVGEILKENNMEIIDFVRLECGETHL